ncbi:MAG TPA: MBL fold metallo-hydrolase [Acidimicrobiales bacterium]|nr:MBL fold metallo-hydrolase [Acidimicrobiales bacterium]
MTSTSRDHPRAHELPPPQTVEVAEGVYAYVQPDGGWWINNTGFVLGEDSVLCIDSCATERRTRAFLDAVAQQQRHRHRARGPRPGARMLVNTHHHGDHTNGNCLFPKATVIGHHLCREAIAAQGILRPDGLWEPVQWGDLEPAPPFVTFERRLDVFVDDLLVELHHFGTAAHTTNDVVAWIPEHRVLFTGDLIFNNGTPFVLMGSVAGSLVALDCVMELDPQVIVPGHGDVCGPEVIDVVGEYLRFLQATAYEAHDAGITPLEAARQTDLGPFAGLAHPERLAGNLHRAMAECEGARPGAPIDLLAAFADMVALNGGEPLTCHA